MLLQSDLILAAFSLTLIFQYPILIPVVATVLGLEVWRRFAAGTTLPEEVNKTVPMKEQLTKLLSDFKVSLVSEEASFISQTEDRDQIFSIQLRLYVMKYKTGEDYLNSQKSSAYPNDIGPMEPLTNIDEYIQKWSDSLSRGYIDNTLPICAPRKAITMKKNYLVIITQS